MLPHLHFGLAIVGFTALAEITTPRAASAAVSILYDFAFYPSVLPVGPRGAVQVDDAGNLFGASKYGGANTSTGSIYELSPPKSGSATWTETTIYSFRAAADSAEPVTLQRAADGTLYGITDGGFSQTEPLIFKLSPPNGTSKVWSFSVLHRFGKKGDGAVQGREPGVSVRGLTLGPDGILYGVDEENANGPSIFALSPPAAGSTAWTFQILATPPYDIYDSRFVFGADGSIYGTSAYAVFKLAKQGATWQFTVLHSASPPSGKTNPYAFYSSNLVIDGFGRLYGARGYQTKYKCGAPDVCAEIVFQLTPPASGATAWGYRVIHTFDPLTGGVLPNSLAIRGLHIVGTTFGNLDCKKEGGGACGTVYELTPPPNGQTTWTSTTLYTLYSGTQGANPFGNPVYRRGTYYGTTYGIPHAGASNSEGIGGQAYSVTP